MAGPGFINFWLAADELAAVACGHPRAGARLRAGPDRRGAQVNVEFVSANPTGPLHVGHGRGAALGDAIASLLEWTGHEVAREFYINDAGVQIDRLAQSLWARVQQAVGRDAVIPEGGYHGEYLEENAAAVLAREGAAFADLAGERGSAAAARLRSRSSAPSRTRTSATFGVRFDTFTSEQAVYDRRRGPQALDAWRDRGLTLRGRTARCGSAPPTFGDDKDRVLRKQDGSLTYFVPDIAYHVDKHERGFDRVIDVWGADHHGYIPRMRAVLAGARAIRPSSSTSRWCSS